MAVDRAALRAAAERTDTDTAVVSRRWLAEVERELSAADALARGQQRMGAAIADIGAAG